MRYLLLALLAAGLSLLAYLNLRGQAAKRLSDKLTAKAPCERCGLDLYKVDRYCAQCGRINPGFSNEVFNEMYQQPLAYTVKTSCRTGHVLQKEQCPHRVVRPFCPNCGEQIQPDEPPRAA